MILCIVLIALSGASLGSARAGRAVNPRWCLSADGAISWAVKPGTAPHEDHIEMSGRRVSVIVRYGTGKDGELVLDRTVVWPMLRTIPNDTHASLIHGFGLNAFPAILVDGKPIGIEKPHTFRHRGLLTIESTAGDGIELIRTIFPSTRKPMVIENCVLRNTSGKALTVDIGPYEETVRTDAAKGVYGEYILQATVIGSRTVELKPGKSAAFSMVFSGRRADEPSLNVIPDAEQKARTDYVAGLWSKLRFECPEPVLSREFDFAKIRAAESIFETKGGLMHGPGGGAYYAAIWANDQAEYANPFFPYLGDPAGNESALNSYRIFARFMRPDYKPVPSSIIAEGTDIWNGAGDRGDAAMIAYGSSRFALASGDRKAAEEMWPVVQWCLEYCRRKTNAEGVVGSNCDELERRFPAGSANLCTSSLTYDALHSAALLGRELGKPESEIAEYQSRAAALRGAIERYFGREMEGFHAYRYYDGNTTLRAWICIPLTMGILDRKDGTIAALFSPKLWTDDGLATEAGKETFWDRSTLYALRGVFAAGETKRAMDYLRYYSQRRLLGEHVPYPVEAWPEGGQRHLSAESALYCRVITEGLFGIRPTGLRSFECTPRLPDGWDKMALRDVHAFGKQFDLVVSREMKGLRLDVRVGGHSAVHYDIAPGETAKVVLPGK